MQPNVAHVYRNAMEFLVIEELEKQFKLIPPRLSRYLNKKEVTAFALNRLPSLYATSEKGWRQQCVRGRRDYGSQITTAVRQGVLAVQKDPLRMESPIAAESTAEQDGQDAHKALQALGFLLHCDDISWQNVVTKVEESLAKAARGEIFEENHATNQPHRRSAWNSAMYRY